MNDNQNKESLFVPTRACKSKKRIELRRSSPLTISIEINSEKEDEIEFNQIKNENELNENDESDLEIKAILTGNENYLKTHFVYDGKESVLKARQIFPYI